MFGSQSFAESSFADDMESSVVKAEGASWSRAAPFEKDLYKYRISDKIGSHNTPTAANLSVNHKHRAIPCPTNRQTKNTVCCVNNRTNGQRVRADGSNAECLKILTKDWPSS